MSEKQPTQPQEQPQATPRIVYGEGVNPTLEISPEAAATTMLELGIPDQAIAETTVLIDPKNRLLNNGTHYPNRIGRLRFRSNPEIQEATGDIVRLSTNVRGRARTEEQINHTLVHELEHLAQGERHDKKVTAGHIAIWGLAAAGALIGNRLGRSRTSKKAGAVLGATLGYELGYMVAPHERQARTRAREVSSSAVRRK